MKCPKCGCTELHRESVDVGVGVGIIHGPWGCPQCRWSEDPKYDCSEEQKYSEGGYYLDQYGVLYPTIRKPKDGNTDN
jgi:hypothetical protein